MSSPVLDIGTGSGIPGIPLAICCPEIAFHLLDSNRRKCAFLQIVVRELKLHNVSVHCGRAEDFSSNTKNHQRYKSLIVRGVSNSNLLLTWGQNLLSKSGRIILWKGSESKKELSEIDLSGWTDPELYPQESGLLLIVLEKC